MQLTGPEILRRMQTEEKPDIIIRPFDMRCLGSNSYDLHLADTLRVYKHTLPSGMKPAIEYKGDKKFHGMRDWFEDEKTYERFCKFPDIYDIRNPHYLIDPTNPKHHETIDIKIPETGTGFITGCRLPGVNGRIHRNAQSVPVHRRKIQRWT